MMKRTAMWRTAIVVAVVGTVGFTVPVRGQEVPQIQVEPKVVVEGGEVKVDGTGFQPGTARLFVDEVEGKPLAELEHEGQFNFLVEISGVAAGAHAMIACNEQARDGSCRELAADSFTVEPPPTTTTSPPRTTTTTKPPRTTTTTSRPAPTTSRPAPPTLPPPPPGPTDPPVTTSAPPSVTIAPTDPPLAVVTTLPPIPTIAGSLSGITTTTTDLAGAADVAVATTSPGPDLAFDDGIDWPDLEVVGVEVTQGIQDLGNRMPLVADRRTWIRVSVAADRFPDGYGDGLDETLAVGDLDTGVSEWSFEGWEGVEGALWLQHGATGTVVYPENGPITAYGDGGERLETDSTLNFIVPDDLDGVGELDVTAFVWSGLPGTVESQEPDGTNNTEQLTVEFHDGGLPTAITMMLENEPVWDAVDVFDYDGAVDQIEESLLIYHPVSAVNLWQLYAEIGPGPEVTEEEDPDGNWDLDERAGEPNTRMGTYHALWDLPDDTWLIGVAPDDASSKWSGWANPGSHAFWTKGSLTTPAHEMGHSGGLLHVGCKDTNEPFGVPDEIGGGAIDPTHPNAFPNCSLAPTDPAGHFGFSTRDEVPEVYGNDPDGPNHRFPWMGYLGEKWSDAYHTCRLLGYYGVACDPYQIGVPPAVEVVDFGQSGDLVGIEPGGWEPFADQDHEKWVFVVSMSMPPTQPGSGAGVEIGPGTVLSDPPHGARRLLERQLGVAAEAWTAAASFPGTDLNTLGLHWARLSGPDRPLDLIVPLMLEGAGHGGGAEERASETLVALPWAEDIDTIEILGAGGELLGSATMSTPPTVAVDAPVVDGKQVAVSWSGSDPDGDALLYHVSISADGGDSWRPVVTMTEATEATLGEELQLAGGDEVVVRVIATDGMATAVADSAPFSLPLATPAVRISDAVVSVEQYEPAEVHASAVDPEDWVITDIAWSSDIDGELGVGTKVSTRWLSVGLHTLTATATDSDGSSSADTLVLEVRPGNRSRPMVEGDRPDVDALLAAAAGVDLATRELPAATPVARQLVASDDEPVVDGNAAAKSAELVDDGAAPAAAGSSSAWAPWAIAAGALGLAGGVLVSRRRTDGSGRVESRTGP